MIDCLDKTIAKEKNCRRIGFLSENLGSSHKKRKALYEKMAASHGKKSASHEKMAAPHEKKSTVFLVKSKNLVIS